VFWNDPRLIHDYIHVEVLKTRDISINENFLQEPGIGPKLVLLALRSFCEGGSEACPELAVALSVVEGMAEWVEWILNKHKRTKS